MYDRKTWLVVIACSALLGLNFYFNSKNQQAIALQKKAEAEAQAKLAPATSDASAATGTAVDNTAIGKGSMEVVPMIPPAEEKTYQLETEQAVFTLSTLGGGIKYTDLKEQFKVGSKTDRIRINATGAAPIAGLVGPDRELNNIPYTYEEAESVPGKKAVFSAIYGQNLRVKKIFSVIEDGKPGSPYLIDFNLQLENLSGAPLGIDAYSLFLGEANPQLIQEKLPASFFWHTADEIHFENGGKFKGGMFSSEKSLITEEGESFDYAGVADQFFTSLIRVKDVSNGKAWFKPTKDHQAVVGGLHLPAVTLAAGEKKASSYTIFVGPRHNAMLRKMGGNWSDIMPYGMVTWVANLLNRFLNALHDLFSGAAAKWAWGLAIIAMTVIVRTAIWPLYAKSARSMKRMSKLQPEMAKLKEKYSDDPNRMNQEMMKLYKTYGVNPLGGCLPMLIQLPIFYGFFRVLQYAVELRGQGFLWVTDLSQPDTQWVIPVFGGIPVNPLPIVMGLTSYIQMAITPMTGDKTQQRIMRLMPIMFFVFCYNFAAALALYWTTTNLFSILQTWLTNKMPEPELKERAKKPGKKSFMERMMEKQQELERQQRERNQGGDPNKMIDVTKKRRSPRTGG